MVRLYTDRDCSGMLQRILLGTRLRQISGIRRTDNHTLSETWWRIAALSVPDEFTLCVCKVAKADHDKVDKCPDTASSACYQHKYACTCLTDIESVNTESSCEEAEKKGYKPILAASVRNINRCRFVYCTSAFYTYNCIVVDLCSAITTIHDEIV